MSIQGKAGGVALTTEVVEIQVQLDNAALGVDGNTEPIADVVVCSPALTYFPGLPTHR